MLNDVPVSVLVEFSRVSSVEVVAASSVNVMLKVRVDFTSNESCIVTVRVKNLFEDSKS